MLKKILIFIVFSYFAFLVFLVFFQRSFIYFPTHNIPTFSEYGLDAKGYETVIVNTKDGLRLRGWYFPAQQQDKETFLWFHGNGQDYASRVYWANYYTKKGYGVILAGYRGYAGNEGKPTERNFYIDGEAWVSAALGPLNIKADQLVFYGESLGSGVAVEMATRYEAKALILHTPYKSLTALAQRKYPFYPITFLMNDKFDNLSRIKNIKMPLLVVHSKDDDVIPYEDARELYDAAPPSKSMETLEGGRHMQVYEYGFDRAVIQFLKSVTP